MAMHDTPSNHVGIFDAKTHLSELVERVRKGESFVLTRHGHAVARLVPVDGTPAAVPDAERAARVKAAFDRIFELRKGITLPPGMTVDDLIDEGRRM
jgi:prevent-host-death family protein